MKTGLLLVASGLAATIAIGGSAHARPVIEGAGTVAKKIHEEPRAPQGPQNQEPNRALSGTGFIWPVVETVNTPFGGDHAGIDIEGLTGDPILAAAGGTITFAGDDGDGYGTKIVIRHDGGYETLYSHLATIKVSGGRVEQGDVIGTIGCTGSCTGDHLHFEILHAGTPTNPIDLLP